MGPDGWIFTSELPFWRYVIFGVLFDYVLEFFELLNHNTSLSLKQNIFNALIGIIELKKTKEKGLSVELINLLSELKTLNVSFATHTLGAGASAGEEPLPVLPGQAASVPSVDKSSCEAASVPPSLAPAPRPTSSTSIAGAQPTAAPRSRSPRAGSVAFDNSQKPKETEQQRDRRLEEAVGVNLAQLRADIENAKREYNANREYKEALYKHRIIDEIEWFVVNNKEYFKEHDLESNICFWSGCSEKIEKFEGRGIFCVKHSKFFDGCFEGLCKIESKKINPDLIIPFLQKTYSEEYIQELKQRVIDGRKSFIALVREVLQRQALYKEALDKLFDYSVGRLELPLRSSVRLYTSDTSEYCVVKDCLNRRDCENKPFCRRCYLHYRDKIDPVLHSCLLPI